MSSQREIILTTNCRFDTEITSFVWELQNVQHLVDWPFKTGPRLRFDAGSSIGLPSKWIFFLMFKKDRTNLIIRLQLRKSPIEFQEVCAHATAEIKRRDGSTAYSSSTPKPKNFKEGYGEMNFDGILYSLIERKDLKNPVVVNGCLKLHLTFKLFSSKWVTTEEVGGQMYRRFREEGRMALAGDLEKLLDSGHDTDVTFQFQTGETLRAHKAILSARSPVFGAMFQTAMKESSTGIVPLEDITCEGMKRMLKFIYCGKIDENWKEKEVIQDLLNASEKYLFPELKEFFNQTLHSICTNENALDLLNVARLYKLELAEKNMFYFIKKNAENIL